MLKKVISDESGRVLALSLIMLGIGALLIPVLLTHTSTNLLATRAIEEGLKEQYAADAGVEYALWHLEDFQRLPGEIPPWILEEFVINAKPVNVRIDGPGVTGLDYALWAGSQTCQKAIEWSGSDITVNGNMHTNNDMLISGSNNTISGTIEYISSFTDSGSGNTYDPPTTSDVGALPITFDIEDYRPEGSAAVQAGSNYHEHTGDWTVSDSDVVLDTGIHYVTGRVTFGGQNISGTVTIVAEGEIELSGSNADLTAYVHSLLFFSNKQGGCGSQVIKVSGSNSNLDGIIYAPGGLIEVSGSHNTRVALIGDQVKVSGQGLTISLPELSGGGLGEGIYKITSTATSADGSSTTIVSYVRIAEGDSDGSSGSPVFENAVVSLDGDVVLTGSSRVLAEDPADCEANVHANGDIRLEGAPFIDGTAIATGTVTIPDWGDPSDFCCGKQDGADQLVPPEVLTSTYKAETQDVQCAECAACGDYTHTNWDESAGTYGRIHASGWMNIGDWHDIPFQFTDTVCAGTDIDIVWSQREVIFEGSAKAGQDLNITGSEAVTFKGPVCVGQDLNIQSGPGEVIFEGPVTVGGSLYVEGGRPVTFGSTVCVGQLLKIEGSGDLIFEGPVKVGGNLDIGGGRPTALNDTVYVEGNMIVGGGEDIPLGGTLYVCGYINMGGTGLRGGETIVAEGNVTLSGSVKLNVGEIPCVISLGSTVSFSGATCVSAAVYAPNAHIGLSGSSKVYGALVGKSVDLEGDVEVEYPPGLANREDLPGGGDDSGDESGSLEIMTYNINP